MTLPASGKAPVSGGTIAAVDIGATKVLVGLADSRGRLLPGQVTRLATPASPASLAGMVAAAVTALGGAPSVVSCAAPGPLDPSRGVLLNMHNREWTSVPWGQLLGDRLRLPVFLEDDATAAALGEALAGAGAGADPVGYLTVSSGVGAGIVIGGRPVRGAHGLAGEIGHLVIDPSGPVCGCGRRGDIESYAGGLCLERRAAELWPEPVLPDGTLAPRSAQQVFALAGRGDPRAAALTGAARHALARAVAALAAVFDPGRIIVGGSIALAQPAWVAAAADEARGLCMTETGAALQVVPAALGDLSALAGAALLGAPRLHAGLTQLPPCPRISPLIRISCMPNICEIVPGNGRAILVVIAHADDLAFFAGGTVARWSAAGWRVIAVRVTDDRWDSVGLSEAETIARNRAEFTRAAEVLGVAETVDLGYQTDVLGDASEVELRERIIRLVRTHKPFALVTFDPYSMFGEDNQDHKLVAAATDEAFWTSQFDLHHPEHLAQGLAVHGCFERWYFGRQVMRVTDSVDITQVAAKKAEAIMCHGTMLANIARQLKLQAATGGWELPIVEEALASGDFRPLAESMVRRRSAPGNGGDDSRLTEEFRVVRFGGMESLLETAGRRLPQAH